MGRDEITVSTELVFFVLKISRLANNEQIFFFEVLVPNYAFYYIFKENTSIKIVFFTNSTFGDFFNLMRKKIIKNRVFTGFYQKI